MIDIIKSKHQRTTGLSIERLATMVSLQHWPNVFLAFLLGLTPVLAACAVAPKAFWTQTKLTKHDMMATDSRLRVIAEAEQGMFSTTGIVEPLRILCTEPSPDVATTLANSLGVGISVFGYGAGSLSTQQVEGLVQLGERTAAIQLLRDKMYQTCLAYANGAITGTSYSLIMSRLDDAIVTLSLGDGAAGAFGRKLAGLGGEASASAEAVVSGLPAEISKIEDQAAKLAAANKRVDDAAKALESHKGTQPAAGKEEEYKALTKKLEEDVATAKAQRDALLQLMQSSAKSASTAVGKISRIEVGGGLSPRPDTNTLREMQAEFLLTDVNRDFISACLVELGLRDTGIKAAIDSLKLKLESRAAAILRARGTELSEFCKKNLRAMIRTATANFHAYRIKRAELSSEIANARYASDVSKFSALDRERFMDSIKLCNTEFTADDARKKACLDQIIPIKSAGPPVQPQAAVSQEAKQEPQPTKQPLLTKQPQATKADQTKELRQPTKPSERGKASPPTKEKRP
jgi:hypothetical protein